MTTAALTITKLSKLKVNRVQTLHESGRPWVGGKFLFSGRRKVYIKGVTYGPFCPDDQGCEYHTPGQVEKDFRDMVSIGINAIRTYTVPPLWLLDLAQSLGIWVMVGIPWEEHVTFLDNTTKVTEIEIKIREGVRSCRQHPAILCYAIGNEIPASIVRWYGRRKIETFLKRLYRAAKEEDSSGLVTYINFPTTEYLQLHFVDIVCFNVYLETQEKFQSYLAHLQNIAGEKPLLMAEIGLDSRRNGEEKQADALDWQIRTTFAEGCGGVFVFSWTDEWYRGGCEIEDWDFGIVRRNREPKPAFEKLHQTFADIPFSISLSWPKISVLVCSYNGARIIRDCCEGLMQLLYPDYEVIVVNDGSTDNTAVIASEFGFRVISTPNRGLSSARNTGLEAATGEIVVYIDDDAKPDPHWLMYLAYTFLTTDFAAVGGPNIAPSGDGFIADCIANAPGGAMHVLLSDREAEHIPGCNMAFRRSVLNAIWGFDPQFRSAGDDVDVCWRIQVEGWKIGFNHAAMVWHHRRNSVKMYWKQQKGYGRAEAMLEKKWPHKYNVLGHLFWAGRIYGRGLTVPLVVRRWRIYHGVWGSALFQSMYQKNPGTWTSVPLMPEWYFVLVVLLSLTLCGFLWEPLLLFFPLFFAAIAATVVQAALSASKNRFEAETHPKLIRYKHYALMTCLHLLQPFARLWGRISHGLTPWRRIRSTDCLFPRTRKFSIWCEHWQLPLKRLTEIELMIKSVPIIVLRGGDYDRWDLEICGGMFGSVRLFMGVEEHGSGKQMIRVSIWPKGSTVAFILTLFLAILSFFSAIDGAIYAFVILGGWTIVLAQWMILECAEAASVVKNVLEKYAKSGEEEEDRRVSPENRS